MERKRPDYSKRGRISGLARLVDPDGGSWHMGRHSSPAQALNHQREEEEYLDGLLGDPPPGNVPDPAIVRQREQLKFEDEVACG